MRKLKRFSWIGFAGLCCAGLWMSTGSLFKSANAQAATDEVKQAGTSYCPLELWLAAYGNYYYAIDTTGGCNPNSYIITNTTYQVGCPDCPSPISTTMRPIPIPKTDEGTQLTPQPDPLFSGVLR